MFPVSEIYASTQGEGPRVGEITVFVRFAGCNLRCPGWPCDTQHAIDPQYRDQWRKMALWDLAGEIKEVARMSGASSITFTGGEPFLHSHICDLADALHTLGLHRQEAFTNGTILYDEYQIHNIDMIMDWKLPGSGEDIMNKNRLINIESLSNAPHMRKHAIKFVCKDDYDLRTAYTLWSSYLQGRELTVYVGRVWDCDLTDAEIVESIMRMKLPWKLNVQMHNYIWPAHERAR